MWPYFIRFLKTYIQPHLLKFSIVQVMHLVAGFVLLVPPLLIRYVIDTVVPDQNYNALLLISGGLILMFAAWSAMAALKEYWGHEIAQRITAKLRNDLYGHFQKLSMSFHENKKTGELLSRIVDDINIIQEIVHHGPETILLSLSILLGTSALLFYLNWRLALVSLSLAPLMIIFTRHIAKNMWNQFRQVRKKKAHLSDQLEENLAGIQVIKAFVGEDQEAEAVGRANEAHYRTRMGVIKWISFLFPGSVFINSVAIAIALFYGGFMTLQGIITVGTFTAFIFYLQRFLQPIIRLMMMIERGGRFFAGIERFFDYMDIRPDIYDTEGAFVPEKVDGTVEFDGVFFGYDEETVLKDINLVASPGQMIALVGPSGAGKTTIIRLIPRFYEPDSGQILLDNTNIKDIRLRALRSHIGLVMQSDFLFSGTVAENIAYGKPTAPIDQIAYVAELANAASFIEDLPDGYETEIGKRGVKLSEGQRQRISIARALLKDPKLLLLDEATSSVDSETELLIQQAIENLRKGRTTFVIAHRLSTILEADKILFIDDGKIIERGTHEELMKANGRYAAHYRIQFESHLSQNG